MSYLAPVRGSAFVDNFERMSETETEQEGGKFVTTGNFPPSDGTVNPCSEGHSGAAVMIAERRRTAKAINIATWTDGRTGDR